MNITDEQIDRAAEKLRPMFSEEMSRGIAREIIEAALAVAGTPSPQQQMVGVKPLEWRVPKEDSPKDPPAEDIALCADGIGGIYGISRKQSVGPERLVWWVEDPFTWTGFASIAEAKSAAQADHEARIRAALASEGQAE